MKKIFLICCVVFLLGMLACKKSEQKKTEMEPAEVMQEEVIVRGATADESGVDVVCKVLGTEFQTEVGSIVAEYKGEKIFLCCQACVDKVKADPEKYFTKEAVEEASEVKKTMSA